MINNNFSNNYNDSCKINLLLDKNNKNEDEDINIENDNKDNQIIQFDNNNDVIKFKSSIKYLYMDKNNKKFRFTLSKYIAKTNTGYYICSDSSCKAHLSTRIK